MADLKDIGGGNKMLDLTGQPSVLDGPAKQLQFLEMYNRVQQAPLEQAKLQGQIANIPLERQRLEAQTASDVYKASNERIQLGHNVLKLAATGDIAGANELQQVYKPGGNTFLELHSDLRKRNAGVFIERDRTTGLTQERDAWSELKITKQIDLSADLVKQTALFNLGRKKDLEDYTISNGIRLEQEGAVSSVREGVQAITDIVNDVVGSRRPVKTPAYPPTAPGEEPIPHVPLEMLPPDLIKKHLRAKAELNAARFANSDPLDRSLRKMTPLPDAEVIHLKGLHVANGTMARDILPRFMELSKKFGPGVLTTPVHDLLSKFNMDASEFRALVSVLGMNAFKQMHAVSGAGYNQKQWEDMKAAIPEKSDTVGAVIGKVAGLIGMNNLNANATLDILQANRHDVGGMKALFRGRDYGEGDSPEVADAQAALNVLPESVKKDRPTLERYLESSSPVLRDKVYKELSIQGTPFPGGIRNTFRKAMGFD